MARKNIHKHTALGWVTKMKGLGPSARALLSWGDLWPLTTCGHKGWGRALCLRQPVQQRRERVTAICVLGDSWPHPWVEIHLQWVKSGWGYPILPSSGLLPGKIPEPSSLSAVWGCKWLGNSPRWKLCHRVAHPGAADRFHVPLSTRAKGEACVISLGMGMGWEWRNCAGELTCGCAGSAHPVSPRQWPGTPVTMQFCRLPGCVMLAGKN